MPWCGSWGPPTCGPCWLMPLLALPFMASMLWSFARALRRRRDRLPASAWELLAPHRPVARLPERNPIAVTTRMLEGSHGTQGNDAR